MGKSQTRSCSIFHLIKCKAVTQPAGGRHGKGSRLISSSSQCRVVTHVRLCLSYQAPEELNSSLSHHSEVISGCNVCVQNTPARKPSAFCQSRNSQDGARPCYLGSQQEIQLGSSGFASLVTRCCFSLCWGHRTTIARKKPQADKQAEIICYF